MDGMSPAARGLHELAQTNREELRATFAALAPTAKTLLGAVSAYAGGRDKRVQLDRASAFELEYMHTLQDEEHFVLYDHWAEILKGVAMKHR